MRGADAAPRISIAPGGWVELRAEARAHSLLLDDGLTASNERFSPSLSKLLSFVEGEWGDGGFKMEIPEVATTPRGPGLSAPGTHLFLSKLYDLACLPVM